ncbi:MAG: alpha/beta hydrolase [Coriobacteriia bacterium]|nr:alpha/beta hydrolase [Coriobacteriia bacterium]
METRRELWRFAASNKEGDLFAHAWLPKAPRALVQIAHGMSEHGARYDEFARFLSSHGFCVIANDHAGHGLSAQGHLGAFSAFAGGFDCAVKDLHGLFGLAEERLGQLPRLLFGHSMGSVLAALYAERFAGLSALTMSATPAAIGFSHLFQFLAGTIATTRGQLASSPLLERLSGSAANLPLAEAEHAREWLSRDTEKVREFCKDPLCGFDYTAGGYYTMLRGYHHINTRSWGQGIPDIPILVAAGTDDSASDFGKGPARYAAQLLRTGHTQVELVLFEQCRHELTNELNRQEVYAFLTDWFTQALP